jgi:hypothetical protein
MVSKLKMDYEKIHTKKVDLTHLLAVSNHFFKITANLIDFFILVILLATYIVIANKNSKNESERQHALSSDSESSNKNSG